MYGSDIYGEARLPQLLEELAKIDGLKWIRIMYSYPESITKELVDVIRRHDNICSYFDMPIQHASNKILKLMNRQTTKEELLEKVNMILQRYGYDLSVRAEALPVNVFVDLANELCTK